MKIAFFTSEFPSLSHTFILGQVTGLLERGHEVDIYARRRCATGVVHAVVNRHHLLERIPIPWEAGSGATAHGEATRHSSVRGAKSSPGAMSGPCLAAQPNDVSQARAAFSTIDSVKVFMDASRSTQPHRVQPNSRSNKPTAAKANSASASINGRVPYLSCSFGLPLECRLATILAADKMTWGLSFSRSIFSIRGPKSS